MIGQECDWVHFARATVGLNIEYNCEICGNYKYYGPRAFDRHFSEWRHTHGLKCLGIGTYSAKHAVFAVRVVRVLACVADADYSDLCWPCDTLPCPTAPDVFKFFHGITSIEDA